MWENHLELHTRVVAILGEDIEGCNIIASLNLIGKQAILEAYVKFTKPPLNFANKGNDTLRLDLFFEPITSLVFDTDKQGSAIDTIHFIDEKNVEISLGRFVYKFSADKIYFSGFQALLYEKVIDNNFGRMVEDDN